MEKTTEKMLNRLMKACGLGKVVSPVEPVSGGFLHRMYKVTTDCGSFAVKHLNRNIMDRAKARENYERAEMLEGLLEREGLPVVSALSVNGRKMQHMEGCFFYLFEWQKGSITDWEHITEEQCKMAGNILGRIHAVSPENIPHEAPVLSEIDWHAYARRARQEGSEIAFLLEENEELLQYAQMEMNRARAALPDIRCISDEDMDPKNVMWCDGCPRVIDLECLDYGNPVSHALQLSLQWAGVTTCSLDTDKMTAFFEGYLEAYDNHFRAYSDVLGLAYTWVEWLEYNIRRALGECVDEEERRLGVSQVRATLRRIRHIREREGEIREVLDTRLPKGRG